MPVWPTTGRWTKTGREVTDPSQIHEGKIEGSEKDGLDRFCSSNLFAEGEYGLADDVYFCGEEVTDGLAHALDIHVAAQFTHCRGWGAARGRT